MLILKQHSIRKTFRYAAFLILFLVSGCAVKAPEPSADLGARVPLKQCANDPSTQWWARDGFAWSRYSKVMLEHVAFSWGDANDISQQEMDDISAHTHRALEESLSPDFSLVQERGPGVLGVRLRITEVVTSRPFLNVITTAAVFVPLDMGGASIEAELYDGESGEMVAAMTAKKMGTPLQVIGSLSRFGHAKSALDTWAKELKAALVTQP